MLIICLSPFFWDLFRIFSSFNPLSILYEICPLKVLCCICCCCCCICMLVVLMFLGTYISGIEAYIDLFKSFAESDDASILDDDFFNASKY